jgi:hypothetical protein
MDKQDKQGVRTPSALELKYGLGNLDKRFAEVIGIATDARDKVESVRSELSSEFTKSMTSLARDTERIVLAALQEYAKTSDLETFRQTVSSELSVMAERVTINFTQTTEQLTRVDGDLQTMVEELKKNFEFSVDGLTIKAGESAMALKLDNDEIVFTKNGEEFGRWDGVDFHTGNIVIDLNERAQIGNFAFVPRSDGSLDFLKVGG